MFFFLEFKMSRRYYCDYCDKTFIDDLEARKKHLSSSHHIKLKKLHYEMHRGIIEITIQVSIYIRILFNRFKDYIRRRID